MHETKGRRWNSRPEQGFFSPPANKPTPAPLGKLIWQEKNESGIKFENEEKNSPPILGYD